MSSLQERLAARREQLQQDRTVVLPIPGYEGMLAARYRILSYKELRKIGRRNANTADEDQSDLDNAADTLINACVELLEVKAPGEYVTTEHKWTPAAARDLFGLDLGEGATARAAIYAVFPPTQTELMVHFNAYDSHVASAVGEIDEEILGNSEPSTEGS